jgi:spore maturation protein CgeB
MKGEGGIKKKKYADEPSSDEPADIDNPWALAWHMYGKGAQPHYKPEKGKPRYKSPEKYAADKAKKQEATELQAAQSRFYEIMGCRLTQTQAPTKHVF